MAVFFLGCLASCGGPERPEPDETFRAIQVHEATIAHAGAESERCVPDAECPSADEVCVAAEALCELAEALEDADGETRCALARRRCRQVRQ